MKQPRAVTGNTDDAAQGKVATQIEQQEHERRFNLVAAQLSTEQGVAKIYLGIATP